jgi:ABC-type transport system involved in multi-copper enzyme maturation permease subunit
MLPGPVFNFELLSTARRGRFYTIRAFYAIVLLIILWAIHSSWSSVYEGAELPTSMVKWFALSALGGITFGQEVLVLVLTPALVAGVIADEKKRKTLHYLMASRLTSSEIVLGKLFVRMLYVGVLLGVSVPVMSLLVMLGGIDPRLVLLSCGATLSTAWFLATLSIWVSTIARRPREALFITYGLEGLWLIVPSLVTRTVAIGRPMIDNAVLKLAEWVGASSPADVFWVVSRGMMFGFLARWEDMVYWMIGLQLAAGVVLAALAAVQLRPIFKRQDGAVSKPRGLRAILSRRARSHPRLGDRPMLWKELHTTRARGFARFIGWLLTLILGGFLAYYAVWFGRDAFLEVWQFGYGGRMDWTTVAARGQFYVFLRGVVPLLYLVGIVTGAGAAAAAITSEHEEDAWVSLTATDLTGREIVLAKLLGSLARARRLWAVLGLLIIAGVGADSLHWLTLPVLALVLAVFGWFAAALGVWVSIQLRSTWRAQFLTIASLLLANVAGQGIINMLSIRGFAPQLWPGFTPYEVGKLVMNTDILQRLSQTSWPHLSRFWDLDDGLGWLTIFSIISLMAYAVLAAILTWDALRRFEIVAGRARRGKLPPSNSKKSAVPISSDVQEPVAVGNGVDRPKSSRIATRRSSW